MDIVSKIKTEFKTSSGILYCLSRYIVFVLRICLCLEDLKRVSILFFIVILFNYKVSSVLCDYLSVKYFLFAALILITKDILYCSF